VGGDQAAGTLEGLGQREIRRRTGAARDTIRKAVDSSEPFCYGPRPGRPSKVDPLPLS
jgi:hypothetical protein